MPRDRAQRGKRLFKPGVKPGDWGSLIKFLELITDEVHKLMGYGQDTNGYGTMIRNRLWPKATINQDGILSKEDYRALLGVYDVAQDNSSIANTYFSGQAVSGSGLGSPVWRIRKVEKVGSVWVVKFADGNDEFDNIWNDRLSLTYAPLPTT